MCINVYAFIRLYFHSIFMHTCTRIKKEKRERKDCVYIILFFLFLENDFINILFYFKYEVYILYIYIFFILHHILYCIRYCILYIFCFVNVKIICYNFASSYGNIFCSTVQLLDNLVRSLILINPLVRGKRQVERGRRVFLAHRELYSCLPRAFSRHPDNGLPSKWNRYHCRDVMKWKMKDNDFPYSPETHLRPSAEPFSAFARSPLLFTISLLFFANLCETRMSNKNSTD